MSAKVGQPLESLRRIEIWLLHQIYYHEYSIDFTPSVAKDAKLKNARIGAEQSSLRKFYQSDRISTLMSQTDIFSCITKNL